MKVYDKDGKEIGEVPDDVIQTIPQNVIAPKSSEQTLFETMSKQLSAFVLSICDERNVNKTQIILKLPKAIRGLLEVIDEFIKNPAIVED